MAILNLNKRSNNYGIFAFRKHRFAKNATKKLLIISRAINVKNNDSTFFFDYGAIAYPEGLVGDEMAYFNADKISKVIFTGYSDVEDENMVETINSFLSANPDIVQGDPENWNVSLED